LLAEDARSRGGVRSSSKAVKPRLEIIISGISSTDSLGNTAFCDGILLQS
jgi:hypothetical protein